MTQTPELGRAVADTVGDMEEQTQPWLTLEPGPAWPCLPVPPHHSPAGQKALCPLPAPQPRATACPCCSLSRRRDAGWLCQGSLTALPSLSSGCRSRQGSCRRKTSLFPRASPRLPFPLAEASRGAGELGRLLGSGRRQRQDRTQLGPCAGHSSPRLSKAVFPRQCGQGAPGQPHLCWGSFPWEGAAPIGP